MRLKLPSEKEALILNFLAVRGSLYGLELVDLSNGALKRGTVYVTLGRMQEKGLVRQVEDKKPEGHAGMPRPRYQITATGRRAVAARDLALGALRPARGTP